MTFGEILTFAIACFWLYFGAICILRRPDRVSVRGKSILWLLLAGVCTAALIFSAITQLSLVFYIVLVISTVLVLIVHLITRRIDRINES